MFKRRMKEEKIEEGLDEIRILYDQYISAYGKSENLKTSFNERYYDALRMRMDLGNFLKNEKTAIQNLIAAENHEKQHAAARKEKLDAGRKKKQDTARKVWEENLKRIEKYPDFLFHEEASHDIVKLLGAMKQYEKNHWQDLENLFRSSGTGRQMDTRMEFELKWREFCNPVSGGIPSRIMKYYNLLSHVPREPQEIEWEERQILYDAARFLGALSAFIREFLLDEKLEIGPLSMLKTKKGELDGILDDFRLQDLAKLSGRKFI